jgi:hypothetical protein
MTSISFVSKKSIKKMKPINFKSLKQEMMMAFFIFILIHDQTILGDAAFALTPFVLMAFARTAFVLMAFVP